MNASEISLDKLLDTANKKLYEPIVDRTSLDRWKQEMIDLIERIADQKLSSDVNIQTESQSLDPSNWNDTRQLAHQLLDSSLDEIQYVREKPVWQPIPSEIRSKITDEPCPYEGEPMRNVFNQVLNNVTPFTRGNHHPRFWGWVMGEGTVTGILAEMIAATLNINASGCTHSAVLVERTVIQWMREIFGFPSSSHGGILVTGTSTATIICLATAQRFHLPDVRKQGIVHGQHLIVYTSVEAHSCVPRACETLGWGSKALHKIPVDEHFRMDINKLKQAIIDDRANGLVPFCIVGTAGTVNTGAFDDLVELSAIARSENLWFHVDGAFGSLIILDPKRRHLVAGIENADSLAFDFHKWLHCPYDAGCVLIRNGRHLFETFGVDQSYVGQVDGGCFGDKPWFCDLGMDLSRSFRALKVWCTIKEHGFRRLGEKIADNCEQAQYLASLLEKHEDIIHVIRPITLNIVNLRFESNSLKMKLDDEAIDRFNNDLLAELQESGFALPSMTYVKGRLYIRVCIVSHRVILEDFDSFVNLLLTLYQTRMQTLKL